MTQGQNPVKSVFKNSQLIQGTGHTAVITGWSLKDVIAKKLIPSDYAVIGQLYSATRGIDYIIRNLLYLAHIDHVVIFNATQLDHNSGSALCLHDFFRYGVTEAETRTGVKAWKINSIVEGFIDFDLPLEVLNKLRYSLLVRMVESQQEGIHLVKEWADHTMSYVPRESQYFFKHEEINTKTRIGTVQGHCIHAKTLPEAWLQVLQRVRLSGVVSPTNYGNNWQEILNLTTVIEHPELISYPEWMPIREDFAGAYVEQMLSGNPPADGVKYTYGYRIRSHFEIDQIEWAIENLRQNPSTSRTVINLWDTATDSRSTAPPCLTHIAVRIVENRLSLTATFRSNDMYSAFPSNVIGLFGIQKHIAESLGIATGWLTVISQSAHVYDDCWDVADQTLESHYRPIHHKTEYDDPMGSFVILVQPEGVQVEHLTQGDGEVIDCFFGKNLNHLRHEILHKCPTIQSDHAFYLGCELQKAFAAWRSGEVYNQA